MSTQAVPTVFLSHSHQDKRVARRLVRRLTAHGVKVWLDERELRLGAALTSTLRAQIEAADMLLVVASQAAAVSKWVGMELEFAREQGKTVVPLFVEAVADHERFRDRLGGDATSPQAFADVVHRLLRDLFLSFDLEMPPPDPAALKGGLRELAVEEPDLAPLINGCLDSEGLHQESMDTAFKAPFHSLDDALNALFDLAPNERMAYHAAYGFRAAGAGARALSLWVAKTGNGEQPLDTAVSRELAPALIPTAVKLLGACAPPNNNALYNFIRHNAAQLDEGQRRSVIRLVTFPVRDDTSRYADVLGWVASKHFPDAAEIKLMWSRWIDAGAFDGEPSTPQDLARYLADAHKEGLPGWDDVNESLRRHVRRYLRSGDKKKVHVALGHVRAAADRGAPVLGALLTEANGAPGTAEWKDWEEKDPATAEWMQWFVYETAKEAAGERAWPRAFENADRAVADIERLRQALAKDEQEPDGDA